MSIEELTKAIKERAATPEAIAAFAKRQEARAKEEEEWERSQRHFDYNFRYTI